MTATEIERRALAAYLGLALGDALGATVEFMTPREIAAQYGVHDSIRGGGWLGLKSGQVTDDTTMALALGDAILSTGSVEALPVAQAFDAWMRAGPVDIGTTVRRGIQHFRRTGTAQVPPNEQDAGNGAVMRCLPVALATLGAGEAAVRAACRTQAQVTHNHPLSDAATETVVLMVQDALRGASHDDLLAHRVKPLLDAHPRFAFSGAAVANPSAYVVETIQAVMQVFFATERFADCVVSVVNRGGDADTTGAIGGMLAGALYGLDAIPAEWLAALNPAVRTRIVAQTSALLRVSASAAR